MADFNSIKEKARNWQWAAITGGINSLFLDDLNKYGPVSPSKFENYKKQIAKIQSESVDPTEKVKTAKKIRALFRGRDELDHFLWLSGLAKEAPMNPSMRIRTAIISGG